MHHLLDNLRAFNRRERFFVVGWALDNPSFSLGDKFRVRIANDTGIHIPADAFCAMDFPLDWLIGCLWLTQEERPRYAMVETGEVNRWNDDVDLIVAFQAEGKTQLLLIEAKGVTGWNNAQLRRKAKRLGQIFGNGAAADKWPTVEPSFILASPRKSANIDVADWPLWMKSGDRPRWWLELPLPDGLRKIIRCNEDGKKNADGVFWKVV